MARLANKLQLELHVEDFGPIKEYYGKLGFKIAWERPPEEEKGYLVLHREGVVISFWCGNGNVYKQPYFKNFPSNTPNGYGVEIIIMVKDIKNYYKHVMDFANIVEPLKKQPWGLWDFRAVDPEGYYLRFTTEHDVLSNKYAVK